MPKTMMDVIGLRRDQIEVRREAEAILDKCDNENRDLTPEEKGKLDTSERQLKELKAEEAKVVRENGLEAELAQLGAPPLVELAGSNPSPRQGSSFRSLFPESRGSGEFESLEEFFKVVSSGRYDPRLTGSTRGMTEGTPSEGGFLVPDEFGAFLMDAALENEIIRPRAKVWPMQSETRKVPAWDGFDHSSDTFGGFSGTWLAEAGTATRQTPKLRQMTLTAKKLAIFTQASRELVQDGLTFEDQLKDAMIGALSFYLDYAFLRGTGAGQPLGILNDPALVTVSKETSQAAASFVYENVTNMLARLHPSAFRRAIWIANQTLLPAMMEMSVAVGTGGTALRPVEERNGRFSLLGKELVFTEKLPTKGTLGDVLLVDPSRYVIGMRQELQMDKSVAPGWTEDMADYRTIVRVDGQGTWSAPVTPKNGDSLSWCVTLEARD